MVSLNQLPSVVFTLIIIGMFLSMGMVFLSQSGKTIAGIAGQNSVATNTTNATISALADIVDWLPIIVVVIIFVLIISLFFMLRQSGRM